MKGSDAATRGSARGVVNRRTGQASAGRGARQNIKRDTTVYIYPMAAKMSTMLLIFFNFVLTAFES